MPGKNNCKTSKYKNCLLQIMLVLNLDGFAQDRTDLSVEMGNAENNLLANNYSLF